MALAGRRWGLNLFTTLAHTLSVTARLLAAAFLTLFAYPIPLGRQSP
jgi:hypothetical protein